MGTEWIIWGGVSWPYCFGRRKIHGLPWPEIVGAEVSTYHLFSIYSTLNKLPARPYPRLTSLVIKGSDYFIGSNLLPQVPYLFHITSSGFFLTMKFYGRLRQDTGVIRILNTHPCILASKLKVLVW